MLISLPVSLSLIQRVAQAGNGAFDADLHEQRG